jgi:hypothetical protein
VLHSPPRGAVALQLGFRPDARFAILATRGTYVLVRASDVLVFMEREHYRFCEDWLDPVRQWVEIWDAAQIMTEVEQTFEMIEQRMDRLLTTLGSL